MRSARAFSLLFLLVATAAVADERPPEAPRVVSLNPSLTAILIDLGAQSTLVGVDEYSARQQPQLSHLPTVGGLFTPSLEAVVAVAPDVVVVVPSAQQRDLRDRLQSLGIRVLELPNIDLEQLLGSFETLGTLVGRRERAAQRVGEIRAAFERTRRATAPLPRLRAALVIQRDPLFLVGAGSFLDVMLDAAGGENVASGFSEPYPRVALEWMIEAAPEVILDASDDPDEAPAEYWSRWPSLPAVAAGRVVAIPGRGVMLPGPHLDRGLELLAAALREPETEP